MSVVAGLLGCVEHRPGPLRMIGKLAAGVVILFAVLPGAARAQIIQNVPVVEAMQAYAEPAMLVEIEEGRRIHLRCLGQGAPTVVLTAGLGGWSATWAKVQPEIARFTRTCAWDRAGFGHSDGDHHPQTVTRTVHDLERALAAAGETGPVVWVGSSAGAHEVLTLVDRRPGATAGVVLVDPVRPHDMAREEAAGPRTAAADRAFYASEAHRLRDCARRIEAGDITTGVPGAPCFQYFPETPAAVQQALARRDLDPVRLRTQASAFEEYEPNGERVVREGRDWGETPLIVVSAGAPAAGGLWPETAREEHAAVEADWMQSHVELARLSARGERRIAEGSGHLVQLDRPDAVVSAVAEVVRAARQ